MSLKWYEQHLQQIVRQNQTLKFQNKRKLDSRLISDLITKVFVQLFPDIPPIKISTSNPSVIEQQLSYYQRAASKWIHFLNTKLQLCQSITASSNRQNIFKHKQIQKINKTTIQPRNACLLCGGHREEHSYTRLNRKVTELQRKLQQLELQIRQKEAQEEKYLKQISYLRSITKQMEFELAQGMLAGQKTQAINSSKSNSSQAEVQQLRRQVQIWKGEYDNIWKQHQKCKKKQSFHKTKFQEERVLLNSIQMDKKGSKGSFLRQNKNVWVIREEEPEQSYLIQISSKATSVSDYTTARK